MSNAVSGSASSGPTARARRRMLETLIGRRDADAGQLKWGANLNIGYYDQNLDDFDPENTVTEEVRAGVEGDVKDQDLRNVLALMLFRGDDVDKQIKLLSGGEKARVALCILLLDKPNVLVLDEPTNHLDIASCEALEGALKDFAGTILCVSHDRYFLDKSVSRLLVLDPPALVDFEGNYSAWMQKLAAKSLAEREAREEKKRPAQKQPAKPAPKQQPSKKADNPYMRPFGRLSKVELEKQIMETEIAVADCQQSFGTAKDPAKTKKLQAEYDGLAKKLKELEAEYFTREE